MPRRPLIAWLHLSVLWAFAFVQPLFGVLEDSPEFFVARGNTAADILILTLGLTLLPPTLLVGVELAVWRLEPVRRAVHLLFVGVLVAASVLQVLKDVGGPAAVPIALSLAIGAGVAVAYARTRFVPSVLTVLGPAPLLFLALLIVFSPVSKLVFGTESEPLANAEVRSDVPVVMIVFDELSVATLMNREHEVDATRYPGFARLARDSTWYRGATTVADVTTRALPAILTGSTFVPKTLPIAADYPRNLFTLLGDRYDLDVDESASRLCPTSLCHEDEGSLGTRLGSLVSDLSVVSMHLLLPEDLEEDLPRVDQTFSDFAGDDGARPARRTRFLSGLGDILAGRGAAFQRFVSRVRPGGGRPGLDFLHVQLPHIPWEYLPSGAQYGVAEPMPFPGNEEWPDDPAIPKLGLQRYLLQLRYVDALIGHVLDRLRRTGLYDRSLVVVTADHGLAFQAGRPRRTLTRPTFAEIAGIPLFVKAPRQRSGNVVDAPVRNTDILPTIADQMGIRLPWSTDGRPARTVAGLGRRRVPVDSRDAPPGLTLGLREYRDELDAAVRRLGALGSDDGGRGVFALADRDLLGRRVDRLPVGRLGDGEVELAGSPGFAEGSLRGGAFERSRLAISVGGRIAAITLPYRAHDRLRFWTPLLPGSARTGAGPVDVIAVSGAGSRRRLAEIPQRVRERLTARDGRVTIVTPAGRRIPVSRGAVNGAVDKVVSIAGNALFLEGWAADTRGRRPADRVLVFAGEELLADGVPSRARPDVADAHGAGVLRSGFRLSAGTPRAARLVRSGALHVYAIVGRRASELPPPANVEVVR